MHMCVYTYKQREFYRLMFIRIHLQHLQVFVCVHTYYNIKRNKESHKGCAASIFRTFGVAVGGSFENVRTFRVPLLQQQAVGESAKLAGKSDESAADVRLRQFGETRLEQMFGRVGPATSVVVKDFPAKGSLVQRRAAWGSCQCPALDSTHHVLAFIPALASMKDSVRPHHCCVQPDKCGHWHPG